MRTITRTGVSLSVIAALALYGLQLLAGLVVTLGIILIGVAAGLSIAKWLERDWYGRQLDAGARAGAIACGVAGLSSALYLLGQGPTTIDALAARSQVLGVSLAPLVLALNPLGVVGADIMSVSVATLLGVALAALTAQLFGWGKDKRSLRVIAQARLAAQSQQYGELGAQSTPSGARPASPSVHLYGRPGATGAPLPSPAPAPVPAPGVAGAPLAFKSWDDASTGPAASVGKPGPSAKAPKPATPPAQPQKRRQTSNARAADEGITTDEHAALLAWEAALAEESQPGAITREPKASAFLNEDEHLPAPRRNRKKQQTRDWLC